jgi:hypothetical protein
MSISGVVKVMSCWRMSWGSLIAMQSGLLQCCRATAAPAALIMLAGQGVLRGQVCKTAVKIPVRRLGNMLSSASRGLIRSSIVMELRPIQVVSC